MPGSKAPESFPCFDAEAKFCMRAEARTLTLRPNRHIISIACRLVFPEHIYRPSEELTSPWTRQENEVTVRLSSQLMQTKPHAYSFPRDREASVPTSLSPQENLRGPKAETGSYLDPGPLSSGGLGHARFFSCRLQSSHASASLFPF